LLASNLDHCPLLLSIAGSYFNFPKPFRFEAFWTRDQSSYAVVAETWLSNIEGSPAFSLSKKWKKTKGALKHWNTHHFGNIQLKIKSLMSDISVIQSSPHSAANVVKETALQEALQEQLLREEELWKQKSRELWLTCTELNTKFFHASTTCRRRYNSISSLKNLDGSVIIGRENIGSSLVNHFSFLFLTTNPILDEGIAELVDVVITEDENVVNAIPTYIMSLFLLPKYFCSEINTLIRKFWWGFPQDKNHNLSFLSWDNICSPKALGGLGLHSMEFQNSSLLAGLGWKMTTNQPLL
jgi:hypothetical protein